MRDFRDYPDDQTPDPAPRQFTPESEAPPPDYLKWIFGGIAGALVIALLAFAFTNERAPTGQQTASNPAPITTGSGATPRRETTGSGGVNREPPPIADTQPR
jgi:hypothetical protein